MLIFSSFCFFYVYFFFLNLKLEQNHHLEKFQVFCGSLKKNLPKEEKKI